MQHPLLCLECEDILNQGGETWTNPRLTTVNEAFPFFAILVKHPAANEHEAGGLYSAAENPEIDVEKLTHFAIGICWKAAVHSWKAKEKGEKPRLPTCKTSSNALAPIRYHLEESCFRTSSGSLRGRKVSIRNGLQFH
jgi:hypothetical protein